MKICLVEFNDSNMAGYRWKWQFFANRTADGRFTVSCKQTVEEESALRIPARRGLRNGAEVYDALSSLMDEASYSLSEANKKSAAERLMSIDARLAAEFLTQSQALEE